MTASPFADHAISCALGPVPQADPQPTIGSVGRRAHSSCSGALQIEHQGKCFVYSLHLFKSEEVCGFSEPVQVDGGDLVAHHQGAALADLDRRPEAGLAGAGAG